VEYVPSHDIWIWVLQYIRQGAQNAFRVAISKNPTFGTWYWWDFTPGGVNNTFSNLWFDYPDLALTRSNALITFNAFNGENWQRALVFRLPLNGLASGGAFNYQYWSTTNNGSLRLVQGATDAMYWASHNSLSQLRLFRWADNSNTINWWDVNVNAWNDGSYSAPGPGGLNWLGRADSRITGAALSAGVLTFLWTANNGPNRPVPYVRVVRINETTKAVVGQPDIWNQTSAFAYPAAAPNAQGVLGVTMFFGGGPRHPGHVVGFLDGNSWRLILTAVSSHGPADGKWGDYLDCRRHNPNGNTWVAAGFTLQGGQDRKNVEPRYVQFALQ